MKNQIILNGKITTEVKPKQDFGEATKLLDKLYELYGGNINYATIDEILNTQKELLTKYAIKQQFVFVVVVDMEYDDLYFSIHLLYGDSQLSNQLFMTSLTSDLDNQLQYLRRRYSDAYVCQTEPVLGLEIGDGLEYSANFPVYTIHEGVCDGLYVLQETDGIIQHGATGEQSILDGIGSSIKSEIAK